MDEYESYDATGLAELVRKKEVSAAELVDDAIARVERVNPKLNAVVTPMFDRARAAARAALPAGPFAGVPFLLKDILAAHAGVRMTSGSVLMKDFVPDHDAELTRRLRAAGLIFIGRTNVPEFGFLPTTEPKLFGPCRNPWDLSRSTGGSSGGSAAAVAARVVPMAHANDGGGSIRIPAACCGVFGLKPTRARNPLGPDLGEIMNGLVVEHAVTRSVRDSAALLDATAGPDLGDPYWAPPPARPFAQEVGADPGKLRIAMTLAVPTGAPIDPDCLEATRSAARLCEELGHTVEEAELAIPAEMLRQAFIVVWGAGAALTLRGQELAVGRHAGPGDLEPFSRALVELGEKRSAGDYLFAVAVLQRLSREIAKFFVRHDVWLAPTLARPPAPLGSIDGDAGDAVKLLHELSDYVPFTPMANVTGQPAMSVPLHWNAQGLPIGVQLTGRFGDEATLFRLAAQLERARPWAHRRPPA